MTDDDSFWNQEFERKDEPSDDYYTEERLREKYYESKYSQSDKTQKNKI